MCDISLLHQCIKKTPLFDKLAALSRRNVQTVNLGIIHAVQDADVETDNAGDRQTDRRRE